MRGARTRLVSPEPPGPPGSSLLSQTIVLPEELRDEHGGGDTLLMEEFLACAATGERPRADVLAGLYSVALATAATQSIDRDGAAIDLRPGLSDFL